VAQDVVLGALNGVNGTVFAYGQTGAPRPGAPGRPRARRAGALARAPGSGKTFTVTGGPERYADRGLIPRAISLVFSHIAGRSDASFTVRPPRVALPSALGFRRRAGPPAQVHVAYLEIYNEVAYDLLDAGREARALEDLPRVAVRADDAGAVRLGNLSVHRVASEEEALNLARRTPRAHLYLGALAASWCHSGAEPAAAGRASGGARARSCSWATPTAPSPRRP